MAEGRLTMGIHCRKVGAGGDEQFRHLAAVIFLRGIHDQRRHAVELGIRLPVAAPVAAFLCEPCERPFSPNSCWTGKPSPQNSVGSAMAINARTCGNVAMLLDLRATTFWPPRLWGAGVTLPTGWPCGSLWQCELVGAGRPGGPNKNGVQNLYGPWSIVSSPRASCFFATDYGSRTKLAAQIFQNFW